MEDEINLRDYVDLIQKRWKIIAFIAIGLTLTVFIFSLFQAPVYEARTTILIGSGKGGSSSQFAGLAGIAGMSMSSEGPLGDLMAMLKSKAVAAKVVEDLDLRNRIKGWDDPKISNYKLASSIQGRLKRTKATGNLVELRVEYSDPELSAEIANGFVRALSYYWNELNYTEARKKKEYIEGQMPRVKKELASSEKKVKSFSLLGVKRPTVEFKRLQREFKIQENVYTMLRKEYESVKLEESKEIPPFSVVDKAVAPENPSKPKVKLNTLAGLVLGLFFGTFAAFFKDYWEKSGKRR